MGNGYSEPMDGVQAPLRKDGGAKWAEKVRWSKAGVEKAKNKTEGRSEPCKKM